MSSKSKEMDPRAKENCVTFEPQAWRRHVCKNCFRTRDAHIKKQANGSAVKSKDNDTVSGLAAERPTTTSPKASPRKDQKSKGPDKKVEGACKSPPTTPKKKGGLLSKLTSKKESEDEAPSNGSNKGKGQSGNTGGRNGKTKSEDIVGSTGIEKKSPTSTVSPPTSKKSPLSPTTGKRSRAFSPPGKKSPSPISPPTSKKSPRASKNGSSDKSTSEKNSKGNTDGNDFAPEPKGKGKGKQTKSNQGKGVSKKVRGETQLGGKKDDIGDQQTDVNIVGGDAERKPKINPDLLVDALSGGDNTSDDSARGQEQGQEVLAGTETSETVKDDTITISTPELLDNKTSGSVQLSANTYERDSDIAIVISDEKHKVGDILEANVGDNASLDDVTGRGVIECATSGEPLHSESIHQGSGHLAGPSEVSISGVPSQIYPSSPPPPEEPPKEQRPCGTDNGGQEQASATTEPCLADGGGDQSLSTVEKQAADGTSGGECNTTSANGGLDPCLVAAGTQGVSVGGIKPEGQEQVQGVEGQAKSGTEDTRTLTQGGDSQSSKQQIQGGQEDNTQTLSDPLQPPSSCLTSTDNSTTAEPQTEADENSVDKNLTSPVVSSLPFTDTDTKAATNPTHETSSSSIATETVTLPKEQITPTYHPAKEETFTENEGLLQQTPETGPATNEQQTLETNTGQEIRGEASFPQQETIVSGRVSLDGEPAFLSEGKQNPITHPLVGGKTDKDLAYGALQEVGPTGEKQTLIAEEDQYVTQYHTDTSEITTAKTLSETTAKDKENTIQGEGLAREATQEATSKESGQEPGVTKELSEAGITDTNQSIGTTTEAQIVGSLQSTETGQEIGSQPATEVLFITGSGISFDSSAPRRPSDAILHASAEANIVTETCEVETAEDILYEKGSTGEEEEENGSDAGDVSEKQPELESQATKTEEKADLVDTPSQESHDLLSTEKEEKSDTADSSGQHKLDLSPTGGAHIDTSPVAERPTGVSVDQEKVVTNPEPLGVTEVDISGGNVPAESSHDALEPLQVKGIDASLKEAPISDPSEISGEYSCKDKETDSNIIVLAAPDVPSDEQQDQREIVEPGLLSPGSVRSLSESPEQWYEAEAELPPPPAFSDTQASKLAVCLSPSPGSTTPPGSGLESGSDAQEVQLREETGGSGVRHDPSSVYDTEASSAEVGARAESGRISHTTPGLENQVNRKSYTGDVASQGDQPQQAKPTSPIPDICIENQGSVPIATTSSDSSFIGEVRVLPGVNSFSESTTEAPPVASDVTRGVFGVGEGGRSGLVAGERRTKEEAGGVVVARGNRRRKRRAERPSHQVQEQIPSIPGVVIHEAPPATQPTTPETATPQDPRRKSPPSPISTHSPVSSPTLADTGEPVVRPSASLPQQKQEDSTGSPHQGQGRSDEVIACGPVVASTFTRVSSPSSDLQVAAATISLRTPSASPSASPRSLSPSTPTRSRSPQGTAASADIDDTSNQGQTCVSKVTSFVVSQPKPETTKFTTDPALDFEQTTYVFNNSNLSTDNRQQTTEGFGSYPVQQEDVTTLAKVNVREKGRKSRQQSSDFQNTDNSIFHIARHRPKEGATFESFDRTLQFTPSTSARVRRRRMSDAAYVGEGNMMEGTRMLVENLREKQHLLEEKCGRLEREKSALNDLLNVKKSDFQRTEEKCRNKITDLEILCSRLEAENDRLVERLKLPEAERSEIRDQEIELEELRRKLNEAEDVIGQLTEESTSLQTEIKEMHLEMDEMHDQFRDDEALEFRDLQKELEATAKNCRILQFKLRKVERRNDALQTERLHMEDKIKMLESRLQNNNELNQIRELEEELRMAKEVSVRLHDELEVVEERRAKFEEELDRVQDMFRDSERGRTILQKELNTMTEELELLRAQKSDNGGEKLEVPQEKPTLGKKGKEGSVEYDVEQLMRDLADSLEREHDLKGQLEHEEEENINLRKKLSDMEDENEVIQIQLQKMSSAKSGKYFQQKSTESLDDQSVEQESVELRLQLEMAEEETIVLRRKLDDIDVENEQLKKEVRRLQLKLAGKDSKELKDDEDTRSYDERISAMAQDIDDLKWKLIEKDQERPLKDDKDAENEAERTRAGEHRGMLKKSVSLDGQDSHSDMRRQLEVVIQDTEVFKDKISMLEREKEEIESRNRELQESIDRSKIPLVTADDAAMKNIELQDKIKKLEADNQGLRDTIKRLDERTTALSKEVSKVHLGGESAETKEQLRRLEADVSSFQKTINELQDSNKKLADGLKEYESTDEGKTSRAQHSINTGSGTNEDLVEIIKDLEVENRHLKTQVQNREQENEKLEKEVNEYKEDMDKMLDTFKQRESDLQMELQSWESKNAVLANLLELVTERAESIRSLKSEKSERSLSTVSDVTIGSDDVFGEKFDDFQDWNEKLISRIHSLETLLKEERAKVQSVEKRLLLKDGQQAALTDDMKLHEREKEILLQEQKIKQILEKEKLVIEEELNLCQQQLSETTDQSNSLRERLDKMQKVHDTVRQDFKKVTAELKEENKKSKEYIKQIAAKEAELQKKVEEEKKKGSKDARFPGIGGVKDREPASWRWEKQEMERNMKELRKKVDDLHRQLSRQQVRVKLAGEDQKPRADQTKTKELEAEIKTLKGDADKRKAEIAKMEAQIKTITTTLDFREEQWGAEREVLDSDRLSVIKESTQKDEVLRAKDNIINQKNALIQQKEAALKERENSMLNYDQTLKEKDEAFQCIQTRLNEANEELSKLREEVKAKEEMLKDMETRIKELNANVCARDGRIKEKDDIIENLNRTLSEKESSIEDMDNTIRKAMKSIDEKEIEIKALQADKDRFSADLTNTTTELNNARYKSDDFERKLHSAEKEHGKEIASLVILREKMEAHISQLKTEKSLVDGEIQDLKRVMMEKEDFFRQCRNELENELRTVKEKLHSLEGARAGSQGDKLTKLQLENEDLVNEKTILVKEVKRLARELENAESEWQKEKKTYRKLMKEKDETAKELRSKLESTDITSASSQQSDIIQRAEKVGVEELYESKLRIAQMQIRQVQDEVDELKKDNTQLRELLMSSQRNLADLKHRHDVNVSTWHDERVTLERRALEADESRRQLDALQRVVQELESQVRMMESERSALEIEKKEATTERDAARQSLQAQINRMEEHSAMTSSGKFKWSERQKRESAWEKERSDHQRALTEYQNLVRDLETKVRTAERTRDKDHKDLLSKLENARRNWERESNDLRKKATMNEEKSKQVGGLQQTLIDLQYKLQSDRESWLRERTELQKQLRDAERSKLEEKEKTTQLISEIKKVKELTPLLGRAEGVELEIKRKSDTPTSPEGGPSERSSRVYDLRSPDGGAGSETVRSIPIRRLVDDPYDKPLLEALQHISQLAEDLNKTDIKRVDRPKAPPAFRRSLSTSEVEDYREYIELAEQGEETHYIEPEQQPLVWPENPTNTSAKPPTTPTPTLDSSYGDLLGSHRSRSSYRRVQSAQVPDIQITGATSRHSRPGSARSSMYASGTQSAYSSRDASPDRRFGVRKITPYPVAPPSFLITPSRTPRRVTASVDREIALPERHLQKLYDKLSAIEKEQMSQEELMQERLRREGSIEAQNEALEDRRQRGVRLLVKSMSVDSYRDDPNWMPPEADKNDPNAHFCPKQLDTVFDDAPKSQTLPASVRVGEMTIVPGQKGHSLSQFEIRNTPAVRRHAEQARKQFYENYPPTSSGYFSWPRKSRRDKHEELAARAALETAKGVAAESKPETATITPIQKDSNEALTKGDKRKEVVIPIGKHKKEKHKEEEKKESKFSYFFSSVRDRRKLFSKKSRSVDESPVRKSVMQAGLQAGGAAAPSTFEEPEKVKEAKEVKEATPRPTTLRERFHKRAASLDVTSLFSISSSPHSRGGDPGGSASGTGRRSSVGTNGASSVVSELPTGTSGSGKKDHSRDGTCRVTDPEVCSTTPTLTPKFPRPKTPPNRRLPARWRTPSMEKAKQRPIFFRNSDTDRFEIVVKRRSLSESNVVFLEHMQESQTWNFSETRV